MPSGGATLAAREAEDANDKATLAHAYNGLHSAHHYAGVPEDVPYARLALGPTRSSATSAGQGHSVEQPRRRGLSTPAGSGGAGLLRASQPAVRPARRRGEPGERVVQPGRRPVAAAAASRRPNRSWPTRWPSPAPSRTRSSSPWHCGRVAGSASGWAATRRQPQRLTDARERLTALGLTQELATLEAALAEAKRKQAPQTIDLTTVDLERRGARDLAAAHPRIASKQQEQLQVAGLAVPHALRSSRRRSSSRRSRRPCNARGSLRQRAGCGETHEDVELLRRKVGRADRLVALVHDGHGTGA